MSTNENRGPLGRIAAFAVQLFTVVVALPGYACVVILLAGQCAIAGLGGGAVVFGLGHLPRWYIGASEVHEAFAPLALVWGAAFALLLFANGMYRLVRGLPEE